MAKFYSSFKHPVEHALASLVIKALGDSGKLAPRSWEVTPSSSFAEKYQIYC